MVRFGRIFLLLHSSLKTGNTINKQVIIVDLILTSNENLAMVKLQRQGKLLLADLS
jgi:hypothetical protein